ncbi:hypothetical protein GCM10023189_32450 [Nibrella saemangeumensis]|uniref:DUF4397 domain-containing protein n=1 Tax=Nibrella saemangeumensis TaxID=1084526 RepID=A0ABP8N0D3_9BACT
MKSIRKGALWVVLVASFWACNKGKDPEPALPSYLRVPASLDSYAGSGLVTVEGSGLSLRAEGPEQLNASTKTYSGVLGDISQDDIYVNFTVGQPRPYKERTSVPNQYWAYGSLRIMNTLTPGTYRMGIQESPGPRGEIADLTMNLPGPQVYVTNSGSLTVTESTVIKTEGSSTLRRVKGTFQAVMYADGMGIPTSGRNPNLSGTFDVLLLANN